MAEPRKRKLDKDVNYETGVVTITVKSTGEKVVADSNKLSDKIKGMLIPLALNHRLGDAAAGKDGKEALEAIQKVWDGLLKENFTIRVAAAKGISKKDLAEKVAALKGPEAERAAAVLASLGIEL